MCETIIDSQPYSNTIYESYECYNDDYDDYYYNDFNKTIFANDYATSSIRKWLNDDFYNTAFTSGDKIAIATTKLDNSGYSSTYDSKETEDKIFLLSYDEAKNSNYFASDTKRQAKGSDYAKCQGLDVSSFDSSKGCSYWLLRSPGNSSSYCCEVNSDGYVGDYYYCGVDCSDGGVRPALWINLPS